MRPQKKPEASKSLMEQQPQQQQDPEQQNLQQQYPEQQHPQHPQHPQHSTDLNSSSENSAFIDQVRDHSKMTSHKYPFKEKHYDVFSLANSSHVAYKFYHLRLFHLSVK